MLRVSRECEIMGLDVFKQLEEAYPECECCIDSLSANIVDLPDLTPRLVLAFFAGA